MARLAFLATFLFACVTVQAAGIGDVLGALIGKSGAADHEIAVDDVLAKVSTQINKKLPTAVDSDTRLDKVTSEPGRHFIYHYTVLGSHSDDINPESFDKAIRPQLKSRLCNSAEMQNFLKSDVTISYLYKDKNGQPIGNAKFAPSECDNANRR
jgi:hypothetical protein